MILTPRQTEIARLLHSGMGLKQIARELGISEHTIDSQLTLAKARLSGLGWEGKPTTILAIYYERFHGKHSGTPLKHTG